MKSPQRQLFNPAMSNIRIWQDFSSIRITTLNNLCGKKEKTWLALRNVFHICGTSTCRMTTMGSPLILSVPLYVTFCKLHVIIN